MKQVEVTYHNASGFAEFLIDPDLVESIGNAQPTSRVLEGSFDNGYLEEWAEPAVLPDGRKCYRMYLFNKYDITDAGENPLGAENYPWDNDHVRRIKLID